jgi:hypothetical protein
MHNALKHALSDLLVVVVCHGDEQGQGTFLHHRVVVGDRGAQVGQGQHRVPLNLNLHLHTQGHNHKTTKVG